MYREHISLLVNNIKKDTLPKIADLKGDVLRFSLRSRNVPVSGTRAELVKRLIEFEQSEDVELPAAVGINMQREETMSAQSAAISQLQNEMKELKDMLAQLVTVQMGNAAAAHAGNQQQHPIIDLDINEINNESIPVQATNNVRQASVKEIANTLPEFDPNDDNAISVNQFIDRVNKVVDAYQWDEKFLLLAIYTKLKGPAKMWLDSSPILHTTWKNFAEAIQDAFGANPDEAEVHFNMANATSSTSQMEVAKPPMSCV